MQKYLSLIIQFALTVAPAIVAAATAGWTPVADLGLGIALIGTFQVWVAPNLPDAWYVKPASSLAFAALLATQQVIGSGGFAAITPLQWVMIATAAFAAIGIAAFPNQQQPNTSRAVKAR